jgi:hypothetical protein
MRTETRRIRRKEESEQRMREGGRGRWERERSPVIGREIDCESTGVFFLVRINNSLIEITIQSK